MMIQEIGGIEEFGWNFLVDVQELPKYQKKLDQINLLHWTLGGLGLIKIIVFQYLIKNGLKREMIQLGYSFMLSLLLFQPD